MPMPGRSTRRAHPALLLVLALVAPGVRAADPLPAPAALAAPAAPAADAELGASDWLARRWTETDLEALAAGLRAFRADHGAWPVGDVPRQLSPRYLAPAPRADGWGALYEYSLDSADPTVSWSGPDGVAGTDDDLLALVLEPSRGVTTRGGPRAPAAPAPSRTAAAPTSAPPSPSPPPAGMAHSPEVRDAHGWLLRVASALDSFRAQRGHYPPGGDLAALEVALVPEHLRQGDWRPNDPWGRAWRYRSNDVGTSYSLVTAGSDGVFETLVPLISGPVAGDERDLVLTDGRFARWPAGLEASAAPLRADGARAPVTAVTPTRAPASLPVRKEPPDLEPGRAATTVSRLQVIAALLEAWRKEHGSYPEGDDAGRLVSEDLKSSASVQDGWGRDLAYVTRGAGSRYVLVSAGPNGRLDRFVGDYADLVGSPGPAGDDLLVRDGKLVK